MSGRRRFAAALLATGLAGCAATTQRVALECVPEQVQIYVDGRLLDEPPDALFLRTDEPHKIFVKRPGYEPRLLVLESLRDAEGRARLDRDALCLELVPVGQRRQLQLEAEEGSVEGAR